MDAFVAAHPESFGRYDYHVPTGVFLQSFEFLNSHNVEMTGYVWQIIWAGDSRSRDAWHRLSGGAGGRIRGRGGVADRADDGGEQIGWYFSGKFRQNFDYRLYPFDRQDIWLRICGIRIRRRSVLLVPDFALVPRPDAEHAAGNRERVRLRRLGSVELRVQLRPDRRTTPILACARPVQRRARTPSSTSTSRSSGISSARCWSTSCWSRPSPSSSSSCLLLMAHGHADLRSGSD